jgi:hypothetical protein
MGKVMVEALGAGGIAERCRISAETGRRPLPSPFHLLTLPLPERSPKAILGGHASVCSARWILGAGFGQGRGHGLRTGATTGHVFDTWLPERATRYTFRFFGTLMVVGLRWVGVMGRRSYIHDLSGERLDSALR